MKVGKANFRPAPKVESDVVKIEIIQPRPPVSFDEFDGLNRIIFSRRNKTVHANFMARGVLEMMEKNVRTWKSMSDKVRLSIVLSNLAHFPTSVDHARRVQYQTNARIRSQRNWLFGQQSSKNGY